MNFTDYLMEILFRKSDLGKIMNQVTISGPVKRPEHIHYQFILIFIH